MYKLSMYSCLCILQQTWQISPFQSWHVVKEKILYLTSHNIEQHTTKSLKVATVFCIIISDNRSWNQFNYLAKSLSQGLSILFSIRTYSSQRLLILHILYKIYTEELTINLGQPLLSNTHLSLTASIEAVSVDWLKSHSPAHYSAWPIDAVSFLWLLHCY